MARSRAVLAIAAAVSTLVPLCRCTAPAPRSAGSTGALVHMSGDAQQPAAVVARARARHVRANQLDCGGKWRLDWHEAYAPSPGKLATFADAVKICAAKHGCDAKHQEMGGADIPGGYKIITGSTDAEKDASCCKKCLERLDCEFWVRSTTSMECWLKTGFTGTLYASSVRRGALKSGYWGEGRLANLDEYCPGLKVLGGRKSWSNSNDQV